MKNELQNNSFIEKQIELIKGELKNIIAKKRSQINKGKAVDLYKSLPKIMRLTKQKKMRLQFDKSIWPIHIALQISYKLRDRLYYLKKQ